MIHINHDFFQGFALGLLLFFIVLVIAHEIASYFGSDTY